MTQAHNCLTRGLNAIIQQAPHIPEGSEPGYNSEDVKDLLFYVEAWTKTVQHHHKTEEDHMFSAIEKLAGIPGLMSGLLHQHDVFEGGILELKNYAMKFGDRPDEYRWSAMKSIIDNFGPALMQHLNDEIDILLALEKTCDSEGLSKVTEKAKAVAKASGNIEMLVSFVVSSTY
jgi:hemerythrin-like domain-containing protein